jgi:DnaK suppressor protein
MKQGNEEIESPQELDTAKYRERLLAERERLRQSIQRPSSVESVGEEETDLTGELSDYPDHPADAGTETFDREKDISIRQNNLDLLASVEDALTKIESGTYGICSNCGKPIPVRRLEAMPSAIYCVPCQDLLESAGVG